MTETYFNLDLPKNINTPQTFYKLFLNKEH